jgi:hypothetical protein
MLRREGQDANEASLRRYFAKPPQQPDKSGVVAITILALGAVAIGLLLFLEFDSDSGKTFGIMLLLAGLVGLAIAIPLNRSLLSEYERKLQELRPQPTDQQVDALLRDGILKLVNNAASRLDLDLNSDCVSAPLHIIAPSLKETYGVPSDDVAWKKGEDDKLRFGIYRIMFVFLTKRHLATFVCDFNFLRGVSLNELTGEYHYTDVVAVTTQEYSTSLSLPTGEKMIVTQDFLLSVSSGEGTRITLDASEIRKMTGVDEPPTTGAESAVRVIRAMLRDKKEFAGGESHDQNAGGFQASS